MTLPFLHRPGYPVSRYTLAFYMLFQSPNKGFQPRVVPSLFNKFRIDAEALLQDRCSGNSFQMIKCRPWVLGIDEVDGYRGDSSEVVNATPDEVPCIGKIRRDLDRDARREDIFCHPYDKAHLFRVDTAGSLHHRSFFCTEVLDNYFLYVTISPVKVPDHHQ